MRVWNRAHRGAWHLFGHSHGNLPDDPHALSWDVGVDNNDYAPIHLDELAVIMARKVFRAVDHHRSLEVDVETPAPRDAPT